MKERPGIFLLSKEALLSQALRKKLHVKRPDFHSEFYIRLVESQNG